MPEKHISQTGNSQS